MELFPALPEELGRECLLRVPYTSHNNLAAVCRSWEATVKNPQFYEERRNIGVSQQCICLIELTNLKYCTVITVYDPQQGTWETLPRLPHFPGDHHGIPMHCRCVSVNRKLLVIGGWNPSFLQLLHTVFIYDFSSGRWSRGADIPHLAGRNRLHCRKYFACSVSPEGLVYIAGGADQDGEVVYNARGTDYDREVQRGAAVYNVEEDEWKLLPDMNRRKEAHCFGAFIDGKFFVIGGNSHPEDAEVYDPKTGTWTTLPNMWTVGDWNGPRSFGCTAASSDGRFYFLQKEQGTIQEYDSNENVWRAVGSLPQTLAGTITYCVAWRDMIFVSGYVEGTGRGRDNVFYMLKPPPIGCAAGEWAVVPIQRPTESVDYAVTMSAVTIEI